MRFLRKINIGLVLTIITILAIVIYLVNVENSRKGYKEEIKNVCDSYIGIVNKYAILPEDLQQIGLDSRNINLDNFYNDMEKELRDISVSDPSAKIQKTILEDCVGKDLLDTSNIIVSYDKKIVKISSYDFDGNQVTVTFDSKITVKEKYIEINIETGEQSEKVRENVYDCKGESITLEKKDDGWKIVYANLDYEIYNNQYTTNGNLIM